MVAFFKNHYLVLMIGGLGNQFFQYAFTLNLALENKAPYLLLNENKKHKIILHKYFELPLFDFYLNFFKSKILSKGKFLKPLIKIRNDASYQEQKHLIEQGKVIHGFYQSKDYFTTAFPLIYINIKIKKKYIKLFHQAFPNFKSEKTLCIHIRGGDYKENPTSLLPKSYYEKCLKKIVGLETYKILIVTDDVKYAQEIIPNGLTEFCVQSNEMIIDFQLMINADALIISNSSFSWWAGTLNKRDGVIYAPKNWLGYNNNIEYPKGIMHTNFNWV